MSHRISRETTPYFYDQRAAFALLRARRWRNGLYCPRCKSQHVREVKTVRILEAFSCSDCRYNFTSTADTFFHSGRTPVFLRLQLVAAFEILPESGARPVLAKMLDMKPSTIQKQFELLALLPHVRFIPARADIAPLSAFDTLTGFLEQPAVTFYPGAFGRRVDQLLAPTGRPMRRPSELQQPESPEATA
jgi:hypothetical protein